MQRKLALVCTLVLAVVVASAGAAGAQSIEERLTQFGQDVAVGYISPIVDAFGANLNSGINHQAKTHTFLGFDVGLRLMAVPVPDEAKSFTAPVPPTVPGGGWGVAEILTATAVGEEDGGATLNGTGTMAGQTYTYPGGLGIDLIPLVLPQANVGLPMGTDFILRYLPAVDAGEDIGEVNFLGIGLRHKVSQYIPFFPVDISVYYLHQSLDLGEYLEASANAYGVVASKSMPLLTIYGGFAKESASMTVSYDVAAGGPFPVQHVEFDIDSEVSGRATAGLRLSVLPIAFLSVEASQTFGADNVGPVVGAGIGFNIR